MSLERCSRARLRGGSSARRLGDGAGSRPRCSIRIGLSQLRNSSRGATPMTSTQYAANMARAFMAVELAMASVNCGAPSGTRAQAETLLDEYFALVERLVPLTEDNPLNQRS